MTDGQRVVGKLVKKLERMAPYLADSCRWWPKYIDKDLAAVQRWLQQGRKKR